MPFFWKKANIAIIFLFGFPGKKRGENHSLTAKNGFPAFRIDPQNFPPEPPWVVPELPLKVLVPPPPPPLL